MAFRLIGGNRKWIFDFSGWTTLLSLSVGVASLVVSMAVFSGFEQTLKRSIVDVTGDLQIQVSPRLRDTDTEVKIQNSLGPDFESIMSYSVFEAIAAKNNKISGIAIQAVDFNKVIEVLDLESRIIDGELPQIPTVDSQVNVEKIPVVVGKSFAKKFSLNQGDSFRMIVPQWDDLNPSQFKRIPGTAYISAVADFGKFELDERVVIIDLSFVRQWLGVSDLRTGYIVRLEDSDRAELVGLQLEQDLGPGYRVRDWTSMNTNLLRAIKSERVVIFCILLVIVVAAAFNVFTTLTVLVLKKSSEWSLLRALGSSQKTIFQILTSLGLVIGGLGWLGGVILGFLFCLIFIILERYFQILPSDVYKLTNVQLQIRWQDFLAISGATLIISFLATIGPGLKAAKVNPSEGVRNE